MMFLQRLRMIPNPSLLISRCNSFKSKQKTKAEGEALPDYLDNKIFASCKTVETMADKEDIDGFNAYLAEFKKCVPVEKTAIDCFAK